MNTSIQIKKIQQIQKNKIKLKNMHISNTYFLVYMFFIQMDNIRK
jgi:hypothetical protein